ncbi:MULTISPECIES: hypothetical protein [unclassified Rhizobium]|uniref:hypothetical protein n=1 Tax=unclassified Rhizobium TaxID=2613769 RepID=UPI00117AAB89|nr:MULTISPECIES: hypothetical protein [unclassified Rhizobium]MDH7806840.1 hypothetical protein [Rhizobium sp. AN67]MDQ4408122.1 hypothetical protein [Rhizobium sp. AN63]
MTLMRADARHLMLRFPVADFADQFPCIAKSGVDFLHLFRDRCPVWCSEVGKTGCYRADLIAETTICVAVHGEFFDWYIGEFGHDFSRVLMLKGERKQSQANLPRRKQSWRHPGS